MPGKDSSMDTENSLILLEEKTTTADGFPLSHVPSESEISAHAYEIFLSRGALNGHDLDDWLQAERELSAAIPGAVFFPAA
jgi:hypothetical protein